MLIASTLLRYYSAGMITEPLPQSLEWELKKKKISAHSGGEMEVFFMVSGDVEEEKCVTYNLYRSLSSIFRQNILKWNASQNVLFWIV